jgi:hypothetical protein
VSGDDAGVRSLITPNHIDWGISTASPVGAQADAPIGRLGVPCTR